MSTGSLFVKSEYLVVKSDYLTVKCDYLVLKETMSYNLVIKVTVRNYLVVKLPL